MKKLFGKTTALLLVTAVILSAFAFVPVYADTAQEYIIQWGYNQIDNGLEIGGTSKMRSHGGDDNNKVWELSAQAQVSDPSKCVAYIANTSKFLPVTAETRESVKMTVYYQGGYYGWQGHARPGLVGRLEGIEGNVYITTPTFYDDADLYNALISSTLVSLGLPGQQASAKADSLKNCKSSSLTISFKSAGIPTSLDNCLTASTAALRYSS